jgi:hypothetical protein
VKDLTVAPSASVPATRESFAAALPAMSQALATQTADMPLYLGLPSSSAHKGRWAVGPDLDPVESGDKFVLDPTSIEWGYTVFVAGRPVASNMVPMTAGAPQKPTVADDGSALTEKAIAETTLGYRVTLYRKDGRKVILRGATQGLRFAVANILEKIISTAAESSAFVPVVSLAVDHYVHPVHGTVYTPKIKIVSWMTLADLPA